MIVITALTHKIEIYVYFNILYYTITYTITIMCTLTPGVQTGPSIYFIHSAALPGMYVSPCMYMSPALIQIHTVCTSSIYIMHIHMYINRRLDMRKATFHTQLYLKYALYKSGRKTDSCMKIVTILAIKVYLFTNY